ncbi:phospho-acceptor domain-containing protein [Pseudoduganella flava]|uniref:histidine kinase n=1 Tax=Pseudoduganella flava TaxID=871742 RepID=A0A562PZL5_9BURK|nr:hybrid sensor histidine kinase/response regulator [Pseudoduganella flava]QGZ38589.1 response regulator [Pseudoduganella flava]TWI49844.1 phospho-acceptor domain-containing protein [Pseudoduganella flava]
MDELPAALYDDAACALLLVGPDGLIERANRAAHGWLGYAEGELAHHVRILDLLPVGARLFYHTHCQPLLVANGAVEEIQVDLCGRPGRLPVLINITRRRIGADTFDHWAIFKASDRQAYERELLLARQTAEAALEARRGAEAKLQKLYDQLSEADRHKDEFLATLSHELRNPLSPMRSALDVLKVKSEHGPDWPVLQVFDRQLRHLTRLVDDLMEVSRIAQGRMQLRREPVDLAALARATVHDVGATMAASRHTLHVNVPETPVIVNGDPTRLAQVLVNLLNNAAKYTPEGGKIDLDVACRDGHAEIRVCDNGIGIPPAALAGIFDMFSQLEPALTRSRGGLGIGLALARGIVELHDGTIAADSGGTGCGSAFTVRLPLAAGHAAPAPSVLPDLPRDLRVLVVDDNADAAAMLSQALALSGCAVAVAHSAEAACEAARAFRPTVALLDIGLPDMTGYDLARRLRAMPEGASALLIATTGWGQPKDRERALAAGFDHHLTKPIDLALLAGLLRQRQGPAA